LGDRALPRRQAEGLRPHKPEGSSIDGRLRGLLRKSQWYSIGQYFKVNTLGEQDTTGEHDGAIKAWGDGKLAYQRKALRAANDGTMLKLILSIVIFVTLITTMSRGFALPPGDKGLAPSRKAAMQDAKLPGQALEFEQRCADPNVVLCDPLDSARVRGVSITPKTRNATLPEALKGRSRDWRWCHHVDGVSPSTPKLDRDVKSSGPGSLKFTVPSKSGAAAAGYCQINFTPENSVQFGEGETFFVQFRLRLSCDLLFVDCDPKSPAYKQKRRVFRGTSGPTAFKVSIINAGDHPDLPNPVGSCTWQHLVLVDGGKGIIAGYHSCGWYDGHRASLGLHRKTGRGLYDFQPVRQKKDNPVGGCFNLHPITGQSLSGASDGCILWTADEWLTVTQQVTVGRWVDKLSDPARSSNVRVWVAREGQKPVLVIDYDRNLRRPEKPFMKYGKIWLLPYMTNKDRSEEHPEAYMWFDELIVSRGPIAPAR
jgi:hypothetical protein